MKTKDIVGLVFAFVLLGAVGYFALGNLTAKKSNVSKSALNQVEIVTAISPQLDPNGLLDKLDNTYKVRDYKLPVNLGTGLNNSAPFSL